MFGACGKRRVFPGRSPAYWRKHSDGSRRPDQAEPNRGRNGDRHFRWSARCGPPGRRRSEEPPVPVRIHWLRVHSFGRRRTDRRRIGEGRVARQRVAGALQLRHAAVLLGPIRAGAGQARHKARPGRGEMVRPEGRGHQGPSTVLAHRPAGLAAAALQRRHSGGPEGPDRA